MRHLHIEFYFDICKFFSDVAATTRHAALCPAWRRRWRVIFAFMCSIMMWLCRVRHISLIGKESRWVLLTSHGTWRIPKSESKHIANCHTRITNITAICLYASRTIRHNRWFLLQLSISMLEFAFAYRAPHNKPIFFRSVTSVEGIPRNWYFLWMSAR